MSRTTLEPNVLQQLCDERSRENRQAISKIEEKLNRLDHSVYGNGEPGLVARVSLLEKTIVELDKRLAEAKAEAEAQRNRLKNVRDNIVGGSAIVILTYLIGKVLPLLGQ